MRRYLKEFLSDPRVIENQGLGLEAVLNGIILPIRPRVKGQGLPTRSGTGERNESPLKTITRAQAEKLAAALAPIGQRIVVDWAMRYGNPSIASRLAGAGRARLRAHPGDAALSAILRRDHRDRRATRCSAC